MQRADIERFYREEFGRVLATVIRLGLTFRST